MQWRNVIYFLTFLMGPLVAKVDVKAGDRSNFPKTHRDMIYHEDIRMDNTGNTNENNN